ncbi:hypothetical protein FACS1894188_00250 [Clostridia bacterium]|nr:hypothetical protein FACS1894188_00250 [Clostridia bacterium]
MNWKKFKIQENKPSEGSFILGIDLGNSSSALAYFDLLRNAPEIIDISGGYGKPAAPTVMQYIPTTKEWVFGEYALLNRGLSGDITLTGLLANLGQLIEIDKKMVNAANVLGIFLKELIGNCKGINPKAEVVGIVAAIPDFMPQETQEELRKAFVFAGFEKELIEFVPENICIFNKYFFNKPYKKKETVLLLDFGGRGLRGGIYELNDTQIKNLSYLNSAEISVSRVENAVTNLFTSIYMAQTKSPKISKQVKEQISSFTYQHKDLLFQKPLTKTIKLYFTFAYPPFQSSITKETVDNLTAPYAAMFRDFLEKLFEKNLYDTSKKLSPDMVNTVVCTGGGFGMVWAKSAVRAFFPNSEVLIYKNVKCAIAEGASIIAANKLDAFKTDKLTIYDKLKLPYDFGFKVFKDGQERFIPIVERSSFWWQSTFTKLFILCENIENNSYDLEFFRRDEKGEISREITLKLENLPKRPKGTLRLAVSLKFDNCEKMNITVRDDGFGSIFKKSSYAQNFQINRQ